jgi:hypothetical protein
MHDVVRLRLSGAQPQRPRWQLTREHGQSFEVDRRLVFPYRAVEMRATAVVDLVLVHPHDDPVERAQPRHDTHSAASVGRSRSGNILGNGLIGVGRT